MKPNKILVHIGSIAFIGIILFILFIVFNFVGNAFYNEKLDQNWLSQFDKDEIPIPTPTPTPTPSPNPTPTVDKEIITWSWKDFNENSRTISCTVPKDYFGKCKKNRESGPGNTGIYQYMYNHDVAYLEQFILKFKEMMNSSKMNYYECIELVCSAIQFYPYTLVLDSSEDCPCNTPFGNFTANCKVQTDGRGCCDAIDPFGIYSPYEFFYKKTGDCDTRSVLAYTVLKKLGFDVAVMVSREESHSVLGVYLPNSMSSGYSYGIDESSGKKYLLWELTNPKWRLGRRVNGNDWIVAN